MDLHRKPLSLKGFGVAAAALGSVLVIVPTSGCGVPAAAVLRTAQPLPSGAAPALDDAQVAADARAVRDAQAALGAWHPPTAAPSPTASSRVVTVSRVSSREVAAAEAEVSAAEREAAARQRELDRLLAEQEQSDDPGSYDGQVAAAREELDEAVARLEEARQALVTARSRTATVRGSSSPRPAATAATSPVAATDRAALAQALTEARQVQAVHLAARKDQVARWRADVRARTERVTARNATLARCARRSAVPVWGGLGLLLVGVGALLRSRLTA